MMPGSLVSRQLTIDGDIGDVSQHFYQQGWTDGLPIIPPTHEAVMEMLSHIGGDPQDVIANIPPRWAKATCEKIAVNAVMAGCLPEYMPVLLAAVKAISHPAFNLSGIQATTHPCGVLLLINGPIRQALGINSRSGAFGPCWQSNATIGRAVRLILLNVGGAVPGLTDFSTQGQPSKYTFCVAENEEENPWEPLHVERGYDYGVSTVTAFACENPHNAHQQTANTAESLLKHLSLAMGYPLSNNSLFSDGEPALVLCPEHAALLAQGGYSKDDLKRHLFQHARTPIAWYPDEAITWRLEELRKRGLPTNVEAVPIAQRWQDIQIMVIGGPGKHSSILFTFGLHRSATEPIVDATRRQT
jgi:hypothetical protein